MRYLALALGTVLFANVAFAQGTWDEFINGGGDAGDLPATAQVTDGAGPLSMITGIIAPDGDADTYCIHIDDPSSFEATTTFNGTAIDTQLWLFDENGLGITFDDDDPYYGDGLQSTIRGGYVQYPGCYYLAISTYDWDAMNANGLEIWADSPYNVERAPDGPGAPGPVAAWGGTAYSDGPYQIDLRGASYCIPEPASLSLLALGALLLRRR